MQPQLWRVPPSIEANIGRCEAIALQVTWWWEADSSKYWLSHRTYDPSTGEILDEQSNSFRWKPQDAAGDAGLVIRWIRWSRAMLRPHGGDNHVDHS